MPEVKRRLCQRSFEWDKALVGGPAIKLMPDYFNGLDWVRTGDHCAGVLQRINPQATRTTSGCPNNCGWCAVPKIYGRLNEFSEWPDLPIICDDNLLDASIEHFDKVIDRLVVHGWAEFNQGLDTRKLTDYHAIRLAEIKSPLVYLALDNMEYSEQWVCAYDRLRSAGITKKQLRSYALIGFRSDPAESWQRCNFIESFGVKALPSWYHRLDALEKNAVVKDHIEYGWTDYERRKIMQYFYWHKNAISYQGAI